MRAFAILVLLASTASAAPALDPPYVKWGTSVERAAAVLEAAKIDARQDDRRGYFKDADGNISHTTEPELFWKIPNGRAEALFQWNTTANAWRLAELHLYTDLTDAQLARELAQLERRYGKPHAKRPEHWLWVRGGVWLVVIPGREVDPKTKLRSLAVQFRLDDTPAP